MPIKALILDVRGTMLKRAWFRGAYSIVQGVPEMIERLRKRNIALFAASDNLTDAQAVQKLLHIDRENILFAGQVGAKKGSKRFVGYVCAQLQVLPQELLYLGDHRQDYIEAFHSNVAFFAAGWSNGMLKYGIAVETPQKFAEIVETFFLKSSPWYYRLDAKDGLGRGVMVRTLLDPDRARDSGITALLKSKGARGAGTIKTFHSSDYIALHLFASVYLEGLHLCVDGRGAIWCVYPGHTGMYTSVLTGFIEMMSRQFRAHYLEKLIQRHTRAIHSSYARPRGYAPNMDNQLQTIQLNPRARRKIMDRTVIVLDDFTTRGHSFETARNFLLNAGAKSVICIAVGKYSRAYLARYAYRGVAWDSFAPSTLTEQDFAATPVQAVIDGDASASF